MTFELIADATSPRNEASEQPLEGSVEPPVIVSSAIEWLLQSHLRIEKSLQNIYEKESEKAESLDGPDEALSRGFEGLLSHLF